MSNHEEASSFGKVAIVGMAGRFPGAPSVEALWALSVNGASGVRETASDMDGFVARRGIVDNTDVFDNVHFGVPEHEARIMDPQQRVLLEVAQHAIDDASLDLSRPDVVSVYASSAPGTSQKKTGSLSQQYEVELATSPDLAALRISYRLGLRGESITVQTGCSSSLVAVHMAVQSLLSGQSDVSLVAGVSFPADQEVGYAAEEGMISSPSGHCRPFSSEADGAVPGGGAAAVVLKRLEDALAAGDRIHSVILGSAVNNDGQTKVGFMAPSPTGQAEVIATAHAVAGVTADAISYVETHGTATRMGDQVELEGLIRAFSASAVGPTNCALGSAKANIGHLDRAAGITGFIRACLALREKTIPPMAGFASPNPDLPFHGSGFYVPETVTDWNSVGPRRAGVSAFGVGGTNAHIVLEEPPAQAPPPAVSVPWALLPISGKSSAAVLGFKDALADQLSQRPHALAPLACTLSRLKSRQSWRTFVVASETDDLSLALADAPDPVEARAEPPRVVLAFPGQGDRIVDGLLELYETESVYREALDACADIVFELAGFDIRIDMFAGDESERIETYRDMSRFQPALFSTQWALAELWRSWGIEADAVLGHSLGEITAATYAGVFSLRDALATVVRRSQLFEQAPEGATMAVGLSVSDLTDFLAPGVTIAAMNGADMTVVTGPVSAIEQMANRLESEKLFHKMLNIRHSPHGPTMRPAGDLLTSFMADFVLTTPTLPIPSNVTGEWADHSIATAQYWGDQLCSTVRFIEQIEKLRDLGETIVIEIGPGSGLAKLVGREAGISVRRAIGLSPSARNSDVGVRQRILSAAGEMWSEGVPIDLSLILGVQTEPVQIPPTPFSHTKRWAHSEHNPEVTKELVKRTDPSSWLYAPTFTTVEQRKKVRDSVIVACLGVSPELQQSIERASSDSGAQIALRSFGESPLDPAVTDVLWMLGQEDLPFADAARLAGRLQSDGSAARVWVVGDQFSPMGMVAPAAFAVAVARVAPQEHPGSRWSAVQVGETHDVGEGIADLLRLHRPADLYAIERGVVQVVEREQAWPSWRSRPVHDGGCYVITGGLGRVGRALARAHARQVSSTLVLVGRRSADQVHAELRELQSELGASGTTVHYEQVDITQPSEVLSNFAALRARHGRIDGVIHAAGETRTSQFAPLADSSKSTLQSLCAAKVEGARNIAAALNETDADFIILCSSLSVDIGGLRFGAYVAANVELDNMAVLKHKLGDDRWLSIRWDAWSEDQTNDSTLARLALTEDDGYQVYRRAMAASGPILVVSTGDLVTRIAEIDRELGVAVPMLTASDEGRLLDPAQIVTRVLTEVLGSVPSDQNRDLRADGLESLALLQITSRLSRLAGERIPLSAALKSLSYTGLVELVMHLRPDGGRTPGDDDAMGERASRWEIGDEFPVSSIQRRWLELFPEGYGGIDLAIEVTGESVSAAVLASAASAVVARHASLRTTFTRREGEWRQTISAGAPVEEYDLTRKTTDDAERELQALIKSKHEAWFDLAKSPPFEIAVVRMPEDRHIMLLHAHHVIFDGWSSSIFLDDIKKAIRGRLAPPSKQYFQYAVEQQASLGDAATVEARRYWADHFLGARGPTRISPDIEPDSGQKAAHVSIDFAKSLGQDLRRQAEKLGATPFVLMMAAFGLTIAEITGEEDLILGTTAAGRGEHQVEEVVGVFVNPLPLRINVDTSWSLFQYVSHVRDVLVGFHDHGNYPMEDLSQHTPPFAGVGLNDMFACYILYQSYWRPEDDGIHFEPIRSASDVQHKLMRDLEIVLEEGNEGLQAELWYRADRFSEARANEWARRYENILVMLTDSTVEWDDKIEEVTAPLAP